MLIWTAILIPVVVCVLGLLFFPRKIVYWELFLNLGISFLFILLFKFTDGALQSRDIEYWSGYATRAEYYEFWDEEVPCTHSYDCNCTKDKEGNKSCDTCYQHDYDVDDHPPHWEIYDNNGFEISISSDKFESLARRWKNRQFKDLHRDYHSRDGDMYFTTYPNKDELLEFITTEHAYENKVQAEGANSLFNYRTIKPEEARKLELVDYPPITDDYVLPTFIVEGPKTGDIIIAERNLDIFAAKYGFVKQIRPWIILFNHGTIDRCREQEVYWKGGNKNEFVVCMILQDGQVQATHVFSWTEVDSLKIEARDWFLSNKNGKIRDYTDWLIGELSTKFVRKHFRDFNYITVSPPFSHVVVCWVFTLLLNLGIMYFNINNEYVEKGGPSLPRRFNTVYPRFNNQQRKP